MNALVVRDSTDVLQADTAERRPLATAAWLGTPYKALRAFQTGDFWVGRLGNGPALGARDDRHIGLCSGTRGGKGVSVVIPNLILWPGSVVVIDPKGENALVTARRRAQGSKFCRGMGQKVRILDPFGVVATAQDDFADLKCSFNPMAAITAEREESIDLAARIADSLIVTDGSDSFFDDAAKGLVKAIILHVATSGDYTAGERTLVTVRRCIMAGDYKARLLAEQFAKPGTKIPSGYALLAMSMRKNRAFNGVIVDAGSRLKELEASPRTLASVVQVAATNTDFIDSAGMKRCLSQSDFSLSELKTDPKGTSLFVTLPQRFMETHYRWMRMMTSLIVSEMEQVKGQPKSGHRVLMVLDEFPALKRMRVIENAAAQIAGFGVKLMFVTQTLGQLKDLYKDNWETLFANSGVKQFFFNEDHFTRKYASDLIGECEVVRSAQSSSSSHAVSLGQSRSTTDGSSHGSSWGHSHGSSMSMGQNGGNISDSINVGGSGGLSHSEGSGESTSESWSKTQNVTQSIQKRPLVTPDEVGRMFGGDGNLNALALVSGFQPLIMRRTPYYRDRMFEGLFDPHPDHPLPLTLVELGAKRRKEERERIEREAKEARARELEAAKQRALAAQRRELAARQARIDANNARWEQYCKEKRAALEAKRDRWRNLIFELQEMAWNCVIPVACFPVFWTFFWVLGKFWK